MEKTIKILQFWYAKEVPTSGGETMFTEQIAFQNNTVDITDPYDLQRGEAQDAFYTDAELAAGAAEAPTPYVRAELTPEGEVQTAPLDVSGSGGMTLDWGKATVDEMAAFIETNKVNANDMLAHAHEHPDRVNDMLEAETQASGGNPRKGVSEGLAKIAESNTE